MSETSDSYAMIAAANESPRAFSAAFAVTLATASLSREFPELDPSGELRSEIQSYVPDKKLMNKIVA